MLKLNLGSGQRKFQPPFINVDIQDKWAPDLVADCASLPMFADESAEMIVLHHQLEHGTLEQSKKMLQEAHRLLCPGGSLLIFVPDISALVTGWSEGKINDYILMVNLYGAYMGDPADFHHWGYTMHSLTEHLVKSATWAWIEKFNWRKIPGADIAGPDWWILGIEATK